MWTAGPVVILFAIAAFIFVELPGVKNVPTAGAQGGLEIRVVGRQFYWQFEYPNGVIAVDTMRAPAGVPVTLEVTSPDDGVIHSWWIPALGGKIDAIPGTVNQTWFQADQPGVYRGQCAELCGLQHANMLAAVEVMRADEFTAWPAREESAGGSPARPRSPMRRRSRASSGTGGALCRPWDPAGPASRSTP
jgi:cytochrome c oxidase subunit 2